MSLATAFAIGSILIPMICGPCFLHYHNKLATIKGRQEVLKELQPQRLTIKYIRKMIRLVRIIYERTGPPFCLKSFGVSITLSQVYGAASIALSVVCGGSGTIGDFNIIKHSSVTKSLIRSETISSGLLLAVVILVFFFWHPRAITKKSDFSSEGDWVKYILTFWAFSIPIGIIFGTSSGMVIFLLPTIIGIFIVLNPSRIEAVFVVTLVSTAAVFSLLTIEHTAKYGTPSQVPPESIFGHLLPTALVIPPLYFVSRILGPKLYGLRGIAWAGTGLSSIALLYVLLGQLVGDRVTESMMMVLITWVVLPAINAMNDYLSLGVSHLLLYKIIVSRGRSLVQILWYSIVDLLMATLLVLQSALTIPIALTVTSHLTAVHLDLQAFIEDGRSDVYGDGLWFGLMIVSTLTYTVIHFFLAFVALVFKLADGLSINGVVINSIRDGEDSLMVKFYLSSKWIITVIFWCISAYSAYKLMLVAGHFLVGEKDDGMRIVNLVESIALLGARVFPD